MTTARTIHPVQEGAAQYGASLVDRWDDLIDWNRRRDGEQGFFVEILGGAEAHRVLDTAAGTGYHSVMLAAHGFDVTAVDGSKAMVERTRRNAAAHGHDFPVLCSDWRELSGRLEGTYDAVVCLGSSFPHLFDEADRRAVLAQFYAALKPGGIFIVDHRNFDAVRRQRYRSSGNYYYCGSGVSVSVDHADDRLCRFRYDFPDGDVHHLEVYPILSAELDGLLRDTGFESVQDFGDFKQDFDLDEADFLIHVARKA
ncbi:class I SAM-dependent methyltransferase [Streptomyces sp. NPDC007903]|uniref:class I SAM-dependent methyltransferase n=1 Tax=Streptomyces sp. NPDC007903 TaxID=3364786 RepID=UPI0036ED3D62